MNVSTAFEHSGKDYWLARIDELDIMVIMTTNYKDEFDMEQGIEDGRPMYKYVTYFHGLSSTIEVDIEEAKLWLDWLFVKRFEPKWLDGVDEDLDGLVVYRPCGIQACSRQACMPCGIQACRPCRPCSMQAL